MRNVSNAAEKTTSHILVAAFRAYQAIINSWKGENIWDVPSYDW